MANYDQEQRKHVYRVLEYIEQNLDQKLSLEQLAKLSTYSPSHFHRMFAEIVGETPADYVKRHRLEQAAHFLIYEPNMSVTEVALRCGFSSLSYFTQAFTENFNSSPKAWREGAYREKFPREYLHSKKSKKQSMKTEEQTQQSDYTGFQWIDLAKVRTEVFPESTILFAQRMGAYSHGVVDTWEQVYRYAEARELISSETQMLGVPRNNPYITEADKCRYDCCLTIVSDSEVGTQLEKAVFPGGKYVVYPFDEPVEYSNRQLLIDCYSELYSFWLPRSGYRYLGNPVELVQIQTKPGTLDIDCKITAISLAIEPK